MSWLTIRYVPGFVSDLTSWTTIIERKGTLRQHVTAWPSRTTVTHRAMLQAADIAEIARLVEAVDFAVLADPRRPRAVADDTSTISVNVKERDQVRGFCAPLLWWDWAQHHGNREVLPDLDFGPALELWRAVDRLSPRHLARPVVPPHMDWRANIEPATAELRRLRSSGLDLASALDHMRGRGFTLPAVSEALEEVEAIAPEKIPFLLDARGDWDDF